MLVPARAPRFALGLTLTLVGVEVASRASLVIALLALSQSQSVAVGVSLFAAITSLVAALLRGELVALHTRRAWSELVTAIRARDVRWLETRREDREGTSVMLDAAREVALFRGSTVAQVAAQGLSLIGVAGLVATRLGPGWLLAGAAVIVALALVSMPSMRKQRAAQREAWRRFGEMARDARALVEASVELRAQGCEAPLSRDLLGRVESLARAERDIVRSAAALSMVPMLVAAASLLAPRALFEELAQGSVLVDVGVLAGAGVTIGLGFLRGIETIRRTEPFRKSFAQLVSHHHGAPLIDEPAHETPASRGKIELELVGLAVRHPGSERDTPAGLDLRVDGGGVALLGPNGSGKSTALRAIVGLVSPSSGELRIDGRAASPQSIAQLRVRLSLLPQKPFADPGETLAWHARLVGADAGELTRRIGEVGLTPVLERRRAAGGPLEIVLGSLSGGERQLFFIARALARGSDVLLLDEPEVGLDADARKRVASLLAAEAERCVVILVAHDRAIVPDTFRVVVCPSGEVS